MPRVIHFEFAAQDPERAIEFYRSVFGWEFRKHPGPEEYWHVTTGDPMVTGINGGMVRRGGAVTQTANTIQVPSLADALRQVAAHGGDVLSDRITLAGTGWFAYCRDTEGNVLGLLEPDPSAGNA